MPKWRMTVEVEGPRESFDLDDEDYRTALLAAPINPMLQFAGEGAKGTLFAIERVKEPGKE